MTQRHALVPIPDVSTPNAAALTDQELDRAVAQQLGMLGPAPQFSRDLNACAQMEASLITFDQQKVYIAYLDDWKDRAPFALVTTPARERCIAFLRTAYSMPDRRRPGKQ